MANDDIDVMMQFNMMQNNIIDEWFTEPRRYMLQENPFDGKIIRLIQ